MKGLTTIVELHGVTGVFDTNKASELLGKEQYHGYIKSAKWKAKAEAAKQKAGHCARCGMPVDLRAHHTTYARLGQERPADIEILCRGCHYKEHFVPMEVQRAAKKQRRQRKREMRRTFGSPQAQAAIKMSRQALAHLRECARP